MDHNNTFLRKCSYNFLNILIKLPSNLKPNYFFLSYFFLVLPDYMHTTEHKNTCTKLTKLISHFYLPSSYRWSIHVTYSIIVWTDVKNGYELSLSFFILTLLLLLFFLCVLYIICFPYHSFSLLMLAPLLWQSLHHLRVQPWLMMRHQWAVMSRSPPSLQTPLERPPRNLRIIAPPLAQPC